MADTRTNIGNMKSVILFGLVALCSGKCPEGWRLIRGACYKIVTKFPFESAYDARQTCIKFGADISDIQDQDEYYAIQKMIREGNYIKEGERQTMMHKFYIGSNDIKEDEKHVLLSGEPIKFSDWAPGEPNNLQEGGESCIVVETRTFTWETNGTWWADYSCCHRENIPGVLCQMKENVVDRRYELDPENDIFAWKCFNHTDDCITHNCLNGATCIDKMMRYECKCQDGWKGLHCQKRVKCPPFPTWEGLSVNTSEHIYGTSVSYSCVRNTTLSDNSRSKVSQCNSTGNWNPPVLDCKALPHQIIKKITERTEAEGAVALGTMAIVFLICEGCLMVLMDLHTLTSHIAILKKNCLEGYLWSLFS